MDLLQIVITCVEYTDFLRLTLPAATESGRVTVITTLDDTETQGYVRSRGVALHMTDAFHQDGATFNKAQAMNEVVPSLNGWILLLDADILLDKSISLEGLERHMMYGLPRARVDTWDKYQELLYGRREFDLMPVHHAPWPKGKNYSALPGYFQLFHSDYMPKGTTPFGTQFHRACSYDSFFAVKWKADRADLPGCCYHLGVDCVNWDGRVTGRFEVNNAGMARQHQASLAECPPC